ncbi:MAG: DoxX family membrane protein [Rhodospirillales bacterium]|nr:DoxX family membrane protein [Rhodospirillales bacterium]
MHADHSLLEIIAYVCIAFLFLYRGVDSLRDIQMHLDNMKFHNIPFPKIFVILGFISMFLGGLSVLFDYYVVYGASLLILFVVLANFLYHHFWSMEEPMRKRTHLWIFCNNIGVTGGLLMVIATSLD